MREKVGGGKCEVETIHLEKVRELEKSREEGCPFAARLP